MASYFDVMKIIGMIKCISARMIGRARYKWWKFRHPEAAAEFEAALIQVIDECPNRKGIHELFISDDDDDE